MCSQPVAQEHHDLDRHGSFAARHFLLQFHDLPRQFLMLQVVLHVTRITAFAHEALFCREMVARVGDQPGEKSGERLFATAFHHRRV